MIDLGKIPTYTGNLEHLESHASALKTTASNIRTTGRDVHNTFQGLDAVYDAPEEGDLLRTTIPVRDKADAFAKKLESVSGALTSFASQAKPLVDKMNRLREDARKFVSENKHDDDWKKDQKKVDENERLVHEVGATWVAFQGVEREAANKITALVGGTHFVVDDGSHKTGMYGFRASDVKDAKETPWGTVDEREYTGWRAAWEWTKDNVGGALKGFFVDGVWGTIKGLGSMVNVFDWDNFKKTWSGIGDVFGGVSAYLMTPYDWALDKMFGPVDHSDTDKQKAALRNFGKSLVAWDEWGKNPSRAFGNVLFNVVTIGSGSALKLGKAGQAGKLGAGAEALTAVGKFGAIADPMTWISKGASVTKLKVGDFFNGLKASQAGLDDLGKNLPTGNGVHPGDVPSAPSTPSHPAETPAPPAQGSHAPSTPSPHNPGDIPYTDPKGNKRVLGGDGYIRDEHGNVVPDAPARKEPHKDDLPNTTQPHEHEHQTAPAKEKAKVLEGAGGPSHVEQPGSSHPTSPSSHTPSQPTNMHPGDGAHPSGGGGHGGANTTPHTGGSGHVSDHPTGGGGGAGSHGSSGGGSHLPPSGGGAGSHTPSGGGSGHGADGHGGDTPGTGPGSGGHGETPSGGHNDGPGGHDAGNENPAPGSAEHEPGSGAGGEAEKPASGGETHEPGETGKPDSSHETNTPPGERANEPLPALTPAEKAAHWDHLKEVENRAPEEFDHLKHDPDHKGEINEKSMDEAHVGLDLREQGRLPADIRRPELADRGEFYSETTGEYYDIKGVHSDWPPFNNVRDKSQPFKGAFDPANSDGWVNKQLAKQIEKRGRIVIIDVRNADQAAIDCLKDVVEKRGWGDRVIWYP